MALLQDTLSLLVSGDTPNTTSVSLPVHVGL
jgi:hypothetical protein